MVQRLKELSEQSQRALKLAACLGLQFELAVLARVCEVGPEVARAWLGTALQSGLLQALGADGGTAQAFAFADSAVRQAAYALPLDVNLPEAHLRIGRALWQQTAVLDLEAQLFAIVDQFNLAHDRLSDAAERLAVAGLNLRAGRLAQTAGATPAAANYFRHGLTLLPAGAGADAACQGLRAELHAHLNACAAPSPSGAGPAAGTGSAADRPPGPGEAATLQAQLDENLRRLQQQRRELQQARAEADAALRGRAEFLANMGHEIRTPMNAIIGLSHLALKYESDARQRNYLNQIRQSGQQLLAVLNDMLDFTRAEAGQLDMEIIPFELDTVFETLTGLCAEKAQSRGLELLWHIAPEVPRNLIGDPLRLGQILIHYTRNALRFTEQGEVEVVVSVVALEAASVKLRFDVRDTGIGLSEEQIEGLYSDFARLHNPAERKHGSGGIGLAISRRLAGLMGGEVGVHSTPGAGATFWFTASLGLGTARSRQLQAADLQHKRVLVVDDNANAAAVLCEQLLVLGCRAHGLVSGRAALHELQLAAQAGAPYEVLMTDWQMPEIDGMELVQRVQALQLKPPPRVVLVTAFGSESAGPQAARCGISHLLQKPVSQAMLLETLMDLLGLAETGAPSSEAPSASGAELDPVRGARILLVEDDEINQQVTQEMLESEGFVVALADNGQQALFRLEQSTREQRPFDLVLMDMQMPVLDGVSAVRLVRSMPQYQQLPIVAMTANAQEADRQLCLRSGMNDFVSKPIEPPTLWQALTTWIRPRAGLGKWAGAEGGGRAAAMQTLRRYLQQDDVRAVELFQHWRASLRQQLGEERFQHTEAALRAFNLEAALAMLREGGAFSPQ